MPTADDKKHDLERYATKTVDDLRTGAKAAAEKMLGAKGGPGGESVSKAQFLDYVRRGATQPGAAGRAFRQALLQQMIGAVENPYAQAEDGADAFIPARNGVEHVEELLKEAFPDGWPAESPPPPPMPTPAPAPAPVDYSAILAQIPPDQIAAFLQQAQAAQQPGVMA
jgi:hypothetical protein